MWTPESLAACKSPTDSVKKNGEHEHEDVDMRGVWSSRGTLQICTGWNHYFKNRRGKQEEEREGEQGRNRRAARPIIIVIKAD